MMKGKIRGASPPSSSRDSSLNPPRPSPAAYFRRLGLSDEEAKDLHSHYYREYGLAIRGLVRHHAVDALDYDKHCDAALPLDEVLKDDPRLRKLLSDIDRDKCHVWALTNAYKIVRTCPSLPLAHASPLPAALTTLALRPAARDASAQAPGHC